MTTSYLVFMASSFGARSLAHMQKVRLKWILRDISFSRRRWFMNFKEPTGPSPRTRLGGKINVWVDNELRFSSVQGSEGASFHLKRPRPGLWHNLGQIMGKLQHLVRPPSHELRLPRAYHFLRNHLRGLICVRINHVKRSAHHFSLNHHPPAEAVFGIVPFDSTAIKKMA